MTSNTAFSSSALLLVFFLLQTHGLPFGYFDGLRNNANMKERRGNVDVVRDGDGNEFALCHMVGLFAFSSTLDRNLQSRGPQPVIDLAGSLMAVHHFNNGIGAVVDEVEGINETCNVRFTTEFFDTRFSLFSALETLTEVITRDDPGEILPCTILGAYRSAVTGPTSMLASVHGYPQMSFTASSPELSDEEEYPFFWRVIPPADVSAQVAVNFLSKQVNARHCAVLYVDDNYGSGYQRGFQEAAAGLLKVHSFPIPVRATRKQVEKAMEKIKDTDYRIVFAIIFDQQYETVMLEASRQNIVGPDYFWLFGGGGIGLVIDSLSSEPRSTLAAASIGIGYLDLSVGHGSQEGYVRFLSSWKELGDDAISYLNSKAPTGNETFKPEKDFFQTRQPLSSTLFAYDSVMAMGLAACNATEEETYLNGTTHSEAIVQTQFSGATGPVRINENTNSREPTTAAYSIHHVVARQTQDKSKWILTRSEATVIQPNEDGSKWIIEEREPFVFTDGSNTPPSDLPPGSVDMNYIGGLRFLGYVLCGMVILLSIICAGWTYHRRGSRVVKASQPEFLLMICVGTSVFASAIIPLSVDDEFCTPRGCDIACMAFPWLLSTGSVVIFSALFSKTWRINRIFHHPDRFRRIKVTAKDVMIPFILLMTVNIVTLTCWTIFAPMQFERRANRGTDDHNREDSFYGTCTADTERAGGATPYIVILAVTNFSVVIIANIQAYQARDIRTEFSESRYIAIVMSSMLQALLIGVPLLFLLDDNPRADFLRRTLLIFCLSMVVVLLIFMPKYFFWKADKAAKLAKKEEQERRNANQEVKEEAGLTELATSTEPDDADEGLKLHVVSVVVDKVGSLKHLDDTPNGN